jgi:D-arabinose 1-dehydrogenase-like Zn-dependent alcohol dehydrogenase
MSHPSLDLPLCAPGDTVAISGERQSEIASHYARLGADVASLTGIEDARADLIVLEGPTESEVRSAEAALEPGGTIVILGRPAADASLAGPDAVLSELRVEFVASDRD